ncbi:MAG: tetratricopeptide repeat protein, partial [Acidobacteria bacterium]|nr:tetratricopeptide repeat protein [Acidobacteriota bacterium]
MKRLTLSQSWTIGLLVSAALPAHTVLPAQGQLRPKPIQQDSSEPPIEALWSRVKKQPKNEGLRLQLAIGLARQGPEKYLAALEQLVELLQQNPRHLDARIHFSHLLAATGDLEAAVAEMKKARQMAPRRLDLMLQLGEKQQKAREWTAARQTFEEAIQAYPESAD